MRLLGLKIAEWRLRRAKLMNIFEKLKLTTLRYNYKKPVVFVLLFVLTGTSFAGLFQDDEARRAILSIRKKIETIEQDRINDNQAIQGSNGFKGLRDESQKIKIDLLDLQKSIEELRSDIAKQLGQQEQLTKELSDIKAKQRELAQSFDERMRRFEPVKVNVDGKDFLAEPNETQEYETYLAALRKGDFKLAKQGFNDFLRHYPKSGYQSLSLFWLASAQYAAREYRDAISNFKLAIEANPASAKSPEAMLLIASSYAELKDIRSARKFLEDLIKTYPQSEAATTGKSNLLKLK